ncbi:MAG: hypothetical protein WBK55_08455 [Alphaproteobacteria bacterium]
MNRYKLTSAFLGALMLGGCASVHYVDSVIPPEPGNDCWSTVKRDAIKGNEIVGTAIIDRRFSTECSHDRVHAVKLTVAGEVEGKRLDAISRMLQGIHDSAKNDPVRLRRIENVILGANENFLHREKKVNCQPMGSHNNTLVLAC